MKITDQDLIRWKENTLKVAKNLVKEKDILTYLAEAHLEVIPKKSGSMFFGWAQYKPPVVKAYRSNPSRNFPKVLWEVWNQSGMDHELIGHIYNFYAGLRHDEIDARKTQIGMATYRARDSLIWKLAAAIEPTTRKFQKYMQ